MVKTAGPVVMLKKDNAIGAALVAGAVDRDGQEMDVMANLVDQAIINAALKVMIKVRIC